MWLVGNGNWNLNIAARKRGFDHCSLSWLCRDAHDENPITQTGSGRGDHDRAVHGFVSVDLRDGELESVVRLETRDQVGGSKTKSALGGDQFENQSCFAKYQAGGE